MPSFKSGIEIKHFERVGMRERNCRVSFRQNDVNCREGFKSIEIVFVPFLSMVQVRDGVRNFRVIRIKKLGASKSTQSTVPFGDCCTGKAAIDTADSTVR